MTEPNITIINQQNAVSPTGGTRRRHGFLWWSLIGWWYVPYAFCFGRGWLWGRKNRALGQGGNSATVR